MEITEAQANRLWELWTYLEAARAASNDGALDDVQEVEALRAALRQTRDSVRACLVRVIPEETVWR